MLDALKTQKQVGPIHVQPSKRLVAAIAAAEKLLARRAEIAAKLAEAQLTKTKSAISVDLAREAVVTASAEKAEDAALDFAGARAIVEAAQIRCDALNGQMVEVIGELPAKLEEIDAARLEWRESVFAELKNEFSATVENMNSAFRKLLALREAVGDTAEGFLVLKAVKRAAIYWPGDDRNLISIEERKFVDDGGPSRSGAWETNLAWRHDEQAEALFERHRAPLEFEKKLRAEILKMPAAAGG